MNCWSGLSVVNICFVKTLYRIFLTIIIDSLLNPTCYTELITNEQWVFSTSSVSHQNSVNHLLITQHVECSVGQMILQPLINQQHNLAGLFLSVTLLALATSLCLLRKVTGPCVNTLIGARFSRTFPHGASPQPPQMTARWVINMAAVSHPGLDMSAAACI